MTLLVATIGGLVVGFGLGAISVWEIEAARWEKRRRELSEMLRRGP